MNVGQLLRYYRKLRKLTQGDVASAVNLTQQNVQGWESSRDPRPVPAKHFPALVQLLDIPVGELLKVTPDRDRESAEAFLIRAGLLPRRAATGTGYPPEEPDGPLQVRERAPTYTLPLFADVQCRSFAWADSFELNPEHVSVPEQFWGKDRFVIRARGDSMEPEIRDGDLCIFDPPPANAPDRVKDGSIVVAMLEGDEEGATIKRLVRRPDLVELRPENRALYESLILIEMPDEDRGTRFRHEGKRVNLIVRGVLVGLLRDY